MSLHGLSISLRESPPCDETHDVRVIEQENGGALAAKRPHDGVKRDIVDLLRRGDVLEPFRKLKQRSLLVHPPRQRLLGKLAAIDVMLNAHGVQKSAGGVPDAR